MDSYLSPGKSRDTPTGKNILYNCTKAYLPLPLQEGTENWDGDEYIYP